MKNVTVAVHLSAVILILCAASGRAGQGMLQGERYCPAPGADNSEFLHSYWAVDAKTGEMTRVTANDHRALPEGYETNGQHEEVILVAPNVSVENQYVPYPGASSQPPPPMFQQSGMRESGNPAPQAYPQQSVPYYPEQQQRHMRQAPPRRVDARHGAGGESWGVAAAGGASSGGHRDVAWEEYSSDYQGGAVHSSGRGGAQYSSEGVAVAVPATMESDVQRVKGKAKRQSDKHLSKGKTVRGEKQPWWRHIWRN